MIELILGLFQLPFSTSDQLFSSLLFSILFAAILSWLYLIVVSLRSHFRTPIIKKSEAIFIRSIVGNGINLPFVSIIVPARNEEDNIARCLLSLITQDYPHFEVIAVDDNSTDKTLAIMKKIESTIPQSGILKVISLKDKPDEWTGKTWASQQGYLHSRGDILLFTDADSYYKSKDAVEMAVMQMQNDHLDVLTGVPYLALRDFWSKVVMPVWNLYSEVFGHGMADLNEPKSKVAFVMGSFFMIKRQVFERIGTYHNVKQEIQEDRAIGTLLKEHHYKIRIFKIDEIVSALWSRDLLTLWHGIRRTLIPMAIESKSKVAARALIFLFMLVLPFALLPNVIILYYRAHDANTLTSQSTPLPVLQLTSQKSLLLFANAFLCIMIIIAVAMKGYSKYGLRPHYSFISYAGAIFLIAACAYSIILFLKRKDLQSIPWRGRTHDLLLYSHEKKHLKYR